MAVSPAGVLFALLSLAGNGTFGIFGKFCKAPPDPVLFNSFMAVGVMLSSLTVVPFFPIATGGPFTLGWTWAGALAGALLVFATLNSFIAISLSGLAVAQATWSCVAILVSFLWGAFGPQRDGRGPGAPVTDWVPTGVAVALLVGGVSLVNVAGYVGEAPSSTAVKEVEEGKAEASSAPCATGRSVSSSVRKLALGLVPAVLVGISGGSILVPLAYVEDELSGLLMLPSLGISAAACGLLIGAVYSAASGGKLLPLDVVLYGIVSGFVWNAGNICQILAISYFKMPYGISYPIMQCALVVAGLWGIMLFKELTGIRRISLFLSGVATLIVGVSLLSVFGPGS